MNPQRHKTNPSGESAESLSGPQLWLAARVTLAAIVGVLLLFLTANGLLALVNFYVVSTTFSQYVDRELEIVSYRWGPQTNSEDPRTIKGILHPEGIEIATDDRAVSLLEFGPQHLPVKIAPEESQVVGKRINVRYYKGPPEQLRWWHPGLIHNYPTPQRSHFIKTLGWTIVTGIAASVCFLYVAGGNRIFIRLSK